MENVPLGDERPWEGAGVVTIPGWRRALIRVRAYFLKEVNEIRRQPLLILSLIIGPLLALILFGANYTNSTPRIRTIIVVPAGGLGGVGEEQIRSLAGTNFTIVAITPDRAAAEASLAAGTIDLVRVLPDSLDGVLSGGAGPQIVFVSNAINPLSEGWIQYLACAEINEVNKSILRRTTEQAQQQAATIRVRLSGANDLIDAIQRGGRRHPESAGAERASRRGGPPEPAGGGAARPGDPG